MVLIKKDSLIHLYTNTNTQCYQKNLFEEAPKYILSLSLQPMDKINKLVQLSLNIQMNHESMICKRRIA